MNSSKNAFLRNYTLKIQAGTKQQFGLRGGTLRIISASVPVFFESKQNSSAFYLEQGEEIILSDDVFFNLDIFHNDAADQTFIIAVSENAKIGSAKVSGLVQVSNAIALDSATKDALRFQTYGAAFSSNTILGANVPQVVVSPAANVNGLIISAASAFSNSGAIIYVSLLANTVAPVSVIDGDVICSIDVYTPVSGSNSGAISLKNPIKVAAGKGIYYMATSAEINGLRSCLYTLL